MTVTTGSGKHPFTVPYVALGSVSIDDTKIIEEFVVFLLIIQKCKTILIRRVVGFLASDVYSTNGTREPPIRLVMNVLGPWFNPVCMGV